MRTDPNTPQPRPTETDPDMPQKATVTHNLDTGEDEPLQPETDDEELMDFAPGSDGGSAGDGSAA